MSKSRTVFICSNCGNESPKWLGRCPQCDEWNSYEEKSTSPKRSGGPTSTTRELSSISLENSPRLSLPFNEFNRVLGGGIVSGSLILIGGDPGIGKSTLLLQVAASVAGNNGKVLYVSGEESVSQIKLRANRLGICGDGLFILPETKIEDAIDHADSLLPGLMIVDSIQTVYIEGSGAAGSVSQVRDCTLRLMQWAKATNVPVFLVGHVTKEGAIAGPHLLEHIVDVVLYLEGEQFSSFRLLRGVKNQFGSTNEIGIFEIMDKGLIEVADPSQALMSQRTHGAAGSIIVPTLEGTRPLLVEIQALTNPTSFGMPRRTASGVDFNRLLLIAAVLSRQARIPLGNQDIMANAAGGVRLNEPAIDLGLSLAIASSFHDIRIDPTMVAVGEVGLGGEIRAVSQLERRITESKKLGFNGCIIPSAGTQDIEAPAGMNFQRVSTLSEALKFALGK